MNTPWLGIACALTLLATSVVRHDTELTAAPGRASAESDDGAGRCGGEPCDAVARGLRAFFDRNLDGLVANGRACADCHMPTDSFQLSPASVEARFQFLQWRRR